MDYLDDLENRSIYIIREAYYEFRDIAMLWSCGKDSTALLWLVRKAFFGKVPFPVIFIDTEYQFDEVIRYRDDKVKAWGLDLVVADKKDDPKGAVPRQHDLTRCTTYKTMEERRFKALLLGIRRDEHGIRAKERYFSPRDSDFKWDYTNQPMELWGLHKYKQAEGEHTRVHPLLHWTELDIWRYIKRERIPVIGMYFARNGKRYRSLGCKYCCGPIDSDAKNVDEIIKELETIKTSERAGRAQDKENAYRMQQLRSLGYM